MTELRTIAKEMGLTKISSLRKIELLTAVLKASVEKELEEAKVPAPVAVPSIIDGIDTEISSGFERIKNSTRAAIQEGEDALALHAEFNAASKRALKEYEKNIKNMEVMCMYQLEAGIENIAPEGKRPIYKVNEEIKVQATQENKILRACSLEFRKFADKTMVLSKVGTTDVVSISIDKSLLRKDKYGVIQKHLLKLMQRMKDGSKESLFILFKENGIAKSFPNLRTAVAEAVNKSDVIREFKTLTVTASGLNAATFTVAAIKTFNSKGSVTNSDDRRIEILNKSLNGGFASVYDFKKGEFKKFDDELKAFKAMSRLGLGQAANKELAMSMSTYVIFDNMSEKTMFRKKNGLMVANPGLTDGRADIAAEFFQKSYAKEGVFLRLIDAASLASQGRGIGLKACFKSELRKSLVTQMLYLKNSGCKVNYIVVDGERFKSFEEVVNAGKWTALMTKIEMVADSNANKLIEHDNVFRPTSLAPAKVSDINANWFLTAKLLEMLGAEGAQILMKKAMNHIAKTLKTLGLECEISSEGMVNSYGFNPMLLTNPNNSAQVMEHILKADAKALQIMPAMLSNQIKNAVKSIANSIDNINLLLDWSKYLIVQGDKGCMFHCQILNDNEVYMGMSKEEIKEQIKAGCVIGCRYPISDTNAFIAYKMISKEEMIERISSANTTDEIKESLYDYFINSDKVAFLPGNPQDMETHGGQDWDTDKLQFIGDEDIVKAYIEKAGEEKGSCISTDEIDIAERMICTDFERAIMELQKNPETFVLLDALEASDVSDEEDKFVPTTYKTSTSFISKDAKVNRINANKEMVSYNCNFNSINNSIYNFITSEVANIGNLAIAAMNNIAILLCLKTEMKLNNGESDTAKATVLAFQNYYKCVGTETYVSKYDTVEVAIASKRACKEVIVDFIKSNGNLESLINFLTDIERLSRFPAETSIDATKNNYFIANIFNHCNVVKALGCRSNASTREFFTRTCDAERDSNAMLFNEIVDSLNDGEMMYAHNNYFRIDLIKLNDDNDEVKGAEVYLEKGGFGVISCGCDQDDETNKELLVLGIEDPIHALKREIINNANVLLVVLAKEAETYCKSPEAVELRKEVEVYAPALDTNEFRFITAVKNAYTTATVSLETEEEFEGVSTKEFATNNVVSGLKNAAELALGHLTDAQIGALVVGSIIDTGKKGEAGSISSALYKVFEKEMIAFLTQMGLKNLGLASEKISNIRGKGDLSELVGQEIEILDGEGFVGEVKVYTDNKKACLEGLIVEINNKFYVQADREFKMSSYEDGLILNVNNAQMHDIESSEMEFNFIHRLGIKDKGNKFGKTMYDFYGARPVVGGKSFILGHIDLCGIDHEMVGEMIINKNFTEMCRKDNEGRVYKTIFIGGDVFSAYMNSLKEKEEMHDSSMDIIDFEFDNSSELEAAPTDSDLDFGFGITEIVE